MNKIQQEDGVLSAKLTDKARRIFFLCPLSWSLVQSNKAVIGADNNLEYVYMYTICTQYVFYSFQTLYAYTVRTIIAQNSPLFMAFYGSRLPTAAKVSSFGFKE